MLKPDALVEAVNNLRLESSRLVIRPLGPEDFAVQVEHEMNSEIMGMIRDPLPLDQVEERIRSFGYGWSAEEGAWKGFAVETIADRDLVGQYFFRVVSFENQSVEIGYRFHPSFWGRGYATEAGRCFMTFLDQVVEARKVVGYCVAYNQGSIRVLENLGLEREGLLRQHSRLGGQWRDELVFGRILRS